MADDQKKIIVVDDNEASRVACKNILKSRYAVFPVPSAEKLFELLKRITADLILLDVEMPEMSGYEAARILKTNDAWKNIPLIFLSGRSDAAGEKEGLDLGALRFIVKPVDSALLLECMEKYLS